LGTAAIWTHAWAVRVNDPSKLDTNAILPKIVEAQLSATLAFRRSGQVIPMGQRCRDNPQFASWISVPLAGEGLQDLRACSFGKAEHINPTS